MGEEEEEEEEEKEGEERLQVCVCGKGGGGSRITTRTFEYTTQGKLAGSKGSPKCAKVGTIGGAGCVFRLANDVRTMACSSSRGWGPAPAIHSQPFTAIHTGAVRKPLPPSLPPSLPRHVSYFEGTLYSCEACRGRTRDPE